MTLNERWHKIIAKSMEYSDIVRRWFVVNSDSGVVRFFDAAGQTAMSIAIVRNVVRGINSVWRIYDAYVTKEPCDLHVMSTQEWNDWLALDKKDQEKIRASYVLVQDDDPNTPLKIVHLNNKAKPGNEVTIAADKRQSFEESLVKIMGGKKSKSLNGQDAFDLITHHTGLKFRTRMRNVKIIAASLTLAFCTAGIVVAAIGLTPVFMALAATSQLVSAVREIWHMGEVALSWNSGKWSKETEAKNANEKIRHDLLAEIATSDKQEKERTGKNPDTLNSYLNALAMDRAIFAKEIELSQQRKMISLAEKELVEKTLKANEARKKYRENDPREHVWQDRLAELKGNIISLKREETQIITTLEKRKNSFQNYAVQHPELDQPKLGKLMKLMAADRAATVARSNQIKYRADLSSRFQSLLINISYAIGLTMLLTPLAPLGGIILAIATPYHTTHVMKSATKYKDAIFKSMSADPIGDLRKKAEESANGQPQPSPQRRFTDSTGLRNSSNSGYRVVPSSPPISPKANGSETKILGVLRKNNHGLRKVANNNNPILPENANAQFERKSDDRDLVRNSRWSSISSADEKDDDGDGDSRSKSRSNRYVR